MSDEAGRDLYPGIDIGTASSKGVVVDAGGTLIRQAARPHETSLPGPAGSSTIPKPSGGTSSVR